MRHRCGLLGGGGAGNADFVFDNAVIHHSTAVELIDNDPDRPGLRIHPGRIPDGVDRVVVAVSGGR